MVTIFSTLKPFTGPIEIIQRNAVKSWMKLKGNPEVILLGNEPGVAELCNELSLKHIPNVKCNEYGRPLIKDLFLQGQYASKYKINAYVNGDMILTDSFIDGAERASKFNHYLMVGQRWDLDVNHPIDFEKDDWENVLRIDVKRNGVLHKTTGIDYFVFRQGDWLIDIPLMGVARLAWDNWMVSKAVSRNHTVIDTTKFVFVVHQNHIDPKVIKDYKQLLLNNPECANNRKLADTMGGNVHKGFTNHATWIMEESGKIVKCKL